MSRRRSLPKVPGFYIAIRTQQDIDLGRDYAVLGTQFGGVLETRELAEQKLEERRGHVVDGLVLSIEELQDWRVGERLDDFITRTRKEATS